MTLLHPTPGGACRSTSPRPPSGVDIARDCSNRLRSDLPPAIDHGSLPWLVEKTAYGSPGMLSCGRWRRRCVGNHCPHLRHLFVRATWVSTLR